MDVRRGPNSNEGGRQGKWGGKGEREQKSLGIATAGGGGAAFPQAATNSRADKKMAAAAAEAAPAASTKAGVCVQVPTPMCHCCCPKIGRCHKGEREK